MMYRFILIIITIIFIAGCTTQKKLKVLKNPFSYDSFAKKQTKIAKKQMFVFFQEPVPPAVISHIQPRQVNGSGDLFQEIVNSTKSTIVVKVHLSQDGKVLQSNIISGGSEEENQRVLALVKRIKIRPTLLGGERFSSQVYLHFLR